MSPITDFSGRKYADTIVLFDVDGTLTPARQTISQEMRQVLADLRKKVVIGFVGGSDLSKQEEQLGSAVLGDFDFCFAENGLTAYRLGEQLASQSFIEWIGEEEYSKLVNFILRYIADMDLPKKRGTFVEFRNGMVNVSPIGRNCTREERNEFEKFDLERGLRQKFVQDLKAAFPHLALTYSIGGQISFDVFPTGWDKTYCLRHLEQHGFKTIHFFGDKTFKGGNDYEIYTHPEVTGHAVKTPEDTMRLLAELFP
ncbi:eukaryotic phosphomannomutase [Radiomyces spectabilis]|uniref:eukaryotic phosphomannomutase n=1 Tax=Radiomyces spectabilis TaxID=64574 RepID=UPI00221ED86A|nr:eukaryotic phosphomannomutase [Radiomyces spectabilis]KAI8374312.1 eukaryotic phosphomannomutase [Radiomyces spectabilis]